MLSKQDLENHIEEIQQVSPRPTVEIHLPDGRVFSGPRGIQIGVFMARLPENQADPIVGAVVNDELRELTYPVSLDVRVRPIPMSTADGALIYRRSLTFLLGAVFETLFPDAALAVDHSVASGGYLCKINRARPFTREDMRLLETKMHEIVEQDLPFERREVPIGEAIAYFENKHETDKVRLLHYRQKSHLVLYALGDFKDYHHGYMVPSTGFLRWFSLHFIPELGFILQYPRRHMVTKILPMPDSSKLLDTFRQYGGWLERLGIDHVSALNDAIQAGRIREIVLVSEALHEQKIAEIASAIINHHRAAQIILIAGPSSSGKTTFSKRLSVQLMTYGIYPIPIEMDNYFVDRDKTPHDENGELDYEVLEALNTTLLADHLKRLIAGEEVQLPYYDFKAGKSRPGEVIRLGHDQIIILEGIHGLNPRLIPDVPAEKTFRIYVSALTQLNLDHLNRISTTDTRLLRRIVRDARERGYSALQTIQRWESVRRGEKRHIFPYQEYAKDIFNSALVYDVSALKPLAEPLLRQVPFGTPEYIEAKRLLAFLEWFLPVESELIPDNSILREFIGGSIFREFKIWEKHQE